MKLYLPQIKKVVLSPGKALNTSALYYVKEYQIYSTSGKCYAMVYADNEIVRGNEQFLSIFTFEGKDWVEIDHIEFVHPAKWTLNHRLKLLSPDATGNEGCCFYLEFILSSKDFGVDGIVHMPIISKYLHGTRLVKHDFSEGAQFTENMPPFNIDSEDIGQPWPERLLSLKTNITQKQHRLMEVDHDR